MKQQFKTRTKIRKGLWEFLERLLRWPKSKVDESGYRFIGRLASDEVEVFLEAALGRRLTDVEAAALEENYRPQGLLTPDDCYSFRLASPRYRGSCAPEVEFFGTAVTGYADGEPVVKLAETVSLHLDDSFVQIDDELVASF